MARQVRPNNSFKPNMKKMLTCLSAILILVAQVEACAVEQHRATTLAAKGYELYSWQVADGAWRYSLLPGTNRSKASSEITAAAVSINDMSELKRRLAALAANEQVFWHLPTAAEFSFPAAVVVEDLKTYCSEVQINLQVLE